MGEFRMSRGYFGVGLDNPKTNANIGSALRACGVFGASFIAASGKRYSKHPTDTMCDARHLPLQQVDDLHTIIPYNCVPVAVELIEGAISLPEYQHPERAFYIFGSEDATLGDRVLSWCRDIVVIPVPRCLNLAATVNVVLYDRAAKEHKKRS